ncbi:hypothetical protein ACKKBF_B38300 [Auxenochlorella protothecoides x Auxenochlorella symbiontica]|uniref:RWP-RK domain-containing protein n=1 Tax=Auxenochlorella protothecoides TaxID=3075 RepID=A0A1D2A6A9_AUXPR
MIMGEGDTGFGALKRSRKRTRAGRFSSEITLKELEACYHLPAQVACGRLGVGLTILKRICRAHGVAAWPYRKQYKYELGDTPHPIADTPSGAWERPAGPQPATCRAASPETSSCGLDLLLDAIDGSGDDRAAGGDAAAQSAPPRGAAVPLERAGSSGTLSASTTRRLSMSGSLEPSGQPPAQAPPGADAAGAGAPRTLSRPLPSGSLSLASEASACLSGTLHRPRPMHAAPARPPIPAFRGWTPPAALAAKPQDAARGAPPGEAADGLRRRALASLLSLVLQRGTPGEGAASAAVAAELARCLQHQACRAPAEVRDKAPLCGEAWQPRDVARPPAEDAWQPPAVGAWQQQLDAWQQPQHLDASQQRNLDAWQQVDCWSTGRVMPPATAPAPQHDWRRGVPASTLAAARHDSRQYTHVRHLLASVGRA